MNKFKSIKKIHSFSLNVKAKKIINIYNVNELYYTYNKILENNINYIIIGNGTNSIFLNDYNGYIILNKIRGIKIIEKYNYWKLHVNSGENWNKLVNLTLKNNIPGLENLAMIPGKIGAAPIYNIGAYGSELKDFCIYVDILNLKNNKIIRFNKKQCNFSYRESIFKKLCKKNYIIISIGLKLLKKWKPNISHKIFKSIFLNKKKINFKNIFNIVCQSRKKNIPNYKKIGNSGSFFKNPIINLDELKKIEFNYSNIPYYIEKNNDIKISAGWLIEKCGFKDFRIGDITVNNKNALIILNLGNAKGKDLMYLIKLIYNEVKNKFNINLQLEVSLIYNSKKIDLNDLL